MFLVLSEFRAERFRKIWFECYLTSALNIELMFETSVTEVQVHFYIATFLFYTYVLILYGILTL